MAFPSVRSTATTNGTTASATPVVNLPATIRAGDVLLAIVRVAASGAIGWPAGWNELFDDASDAAAADQAAMAWRKADGTEGATITLSSGNGKFAACVRAVQDAADPNIQPPEFATLAIGTSTAPNPGSLTPTGGAKDYLWMWVGCWEGEQTSPPAGNPTNYSSPSGANSGTGGTVDTNVRVATAIRQLNAASEDPGSWTISVSDDWTATVVAFHPAEVVPAPLVRQRDWPVPPRKLTLLPTMETRPSEDPPPPEPPPIAQHDWPVPLRRESPRWLSTWTQSPAVPPAPPAPPFVPIDWRVPGRRVPQPSLLTWTNSLTTTTLAVVEPMPFRQLEWPVPPRRISLIPTMETRPSEDPEAPAAVPFVPVEWRVPGRTTTPVARLTWTNAPQLFQVDAFPPNRTEWSLPPRRPTVPPEFSAQRLLQTTLAPAQPTPFRPKDWPLPARKPYPRNLLTFVGFYVFDDTQPRPTQEWPGMALLRRRPFVMPMPSGRIPPAAGGTTFTINLAGAMTPTGTIAKVGSKSVGGTSSTSGTVRKAVTKPLAGANSPTGTLAKFVVKALAGALTPTGTIGLINVLLRSFGGAITPSGALQRDASKGLSGEVVPNGAVRKDASRVLSGTTAPSGAVRKDVSKLLAGASQPSGFLATLRVILRSYGGSLAPTGTLRRETQKTVTGSTTPASSLVRDINKSLGGALSTAGTLAKLLTRTFTGAVSFVGTLTTGIAPQIPPVIIRGASMIRERLRGLSAIIERIKGGGQI